MKKPAINNQIACEPAIDQIGDRYDLVLIAARRARELSKGWKSQLDNPAGYSNPVVALNEIEQGLIGRDYLDKELTLSREEQISDHFYNDDDYK